MSEDDFVKYEGKWTRADLPSWVKIREADDMAGNGLRSRVIDIALNEVVEHLNAHHPKPAHHLLSSAAECVLGAEDRVRSAKAERDAAIVRAEQAEKRHTWPKVTPTGHTYVEPRTYEALRHEHDNAAQAEVECWAADECPPEPTWEMVGIAHREVERLLRAAPAVSRADIDGALINVTSNAMNYPDPLQMLGKDLGPLRRKCVDAMCDLFGIEAEPTVDPIEEKAIAAFKVAWHEADMHGDEGNRTRRGIRAARKVIEGAGDE